MLDLHVLSSPTSDYEEIDSGSLSVCICGRASYQSLNGWTEFIHNQEYVQHRSVPGRYAHISLTEKRGSSVCSPK
jgi:hypothetical protein